MLHDVPVRLPRPQEARHKLRLVHRVREVLRLEAEPRVFPVPRPALSRASTRSQPVTRVELHPRRVGRHRHVPTARRLPHLRQHPHGVVAIHVRVVNEVMVEPLRVPRGHVPTDPNPVVARLARPAAEVKLGVRHVLDLTRGDHHVVHRRVRAAPQLDPVVPDRQAAVVSREVEVRVLREAHGGGAICARDHLSRESRVGSGPIVGPHRVRHRDLHGAGEALVAVVGYVRQSHAGSVLEHLGSPPRSVESLGPTVQAVGAVVRDQGVGLAVDGEPCARDAVRHPADDRAEVRAILGIVVAGEAVVTQHDVPSGARRIGHDDAGHRRPERRDVDLDALRPDDDGLEVIAPTSLDDHRDDRRSRGEREEGHEGGVSREVSTRVSQDRCPQDRG